MIYIIIIAFIIYTLFRLSSIERKINNLKSPEVKQQLVHEPAQAQTAQTTSDNINIPQPAPIVVPQAPVSVSLSEPVAPVTAPKSATNTEFNLGGKVFTAIGALAVILGVGFFLRYAFANNLISPSARVFMGCIFAVILVGIGHYFREKYETYAFTLVGVGFGVLYLSIYAAYSFYQLIDPTSAFVILTLVTAASVCMSLSYNSKPLVGYSFIGALVMPFLLPFSANINLLFVYLLIVNAGALFIARFKVWPILTLATLAGTSLIYLRWIFGPAYNDSLFFVTISYCTVIFLSYFTTSLLNFVYRDRDYEGVDAILLYATPITYFLMNMYIMNGQDNIALLATVIGLFNFIVFAVIRFGFGGIGELKKFSEGIFLMASIFIAAAIGLHFDGSAITIGWILQTMAMVLVGYVIRSKTNMVAGVVFSIFTGLRMLFFGLALPVGSVAIFNGRSGVFLLLTLMYAVVWAVFYLDLKSESPIIANKDNSHASKYIGIIGFYFTVFFWITFEAKDFVANYGYYLALMWLVYILVMVSVSFFLKEKLVRYLSYGNIVISFFLMICALWNLDITQHPLFFNIRVLTALVYAAVSAIIVKYMMLYPEQVGVGEKKIKSMFLLSANLAIIWAFTLEILSYFNQQIAGLTNQYDSSAVSIENVKRVSLSVFWLLYALAGLGIGIFRRSVFARYFSIALFGVTIFKIFLYDTANLSDMYRFISFIALGIILLIVGFSYYKFKDRINQFVGTGVGTNVDTNIVKQ